MSVKSRLRGIEASVEWLMEVGRYRGWAAMIDIHDRKQELSDYLAGHPKYADQFGGMEALEVFDLPPPRVRPEPEAPHPQPTLGDVALQAVPQDEEVRVEPSPVLPEPTQPQPEEPSPEPILQGVSSASARKRPDAALRAAPQDEVVPVEPLPERTPPHPEERRVAVRLEGWEPAPLPEPPFVQPFVPPPPDMQVRPVTWRRREASDYDDDPDDMYGKCIVDYDPLAEHFRQDDDEDE